MGSREILCELVKKKLPLSFMKRIVAICLILLYLPSVIGVQLCAHYCGSVLHSVSVYSHANESTCCGTTTKKDCCRDQEKMIKVSDSHRVLALPSAEGSHEVCLLPLQTVTRNLFFFSRRHNEIRRKVNVLPPDRGKVNLHDRYGVYRI